MNVHVDNILDFKLSHLAMAACDDVLNKTEGETFGSLSAPLAR